MQRVTPSRTRHDKTVSGAVKMVQNIALVLYFGLARFGFTSKPCVWWRTSTNFPMDAFAVLPRLIVIEDIAVTQNLNTQKTGRFLTAVVRCVRDQDIFMEPAES